MKKVLVLDFGGQYNLLVARRVRECGVYCEIRSWRESMENIRGFQPDALIFTGGPATVFEPNAPMVDPALFSMGIPVLGICYGQQLMIHLLGGQCRRAGTREYGKVELTHNGKSPLFKDIPATAVYWMSHGVEVETLAPGFEVVASTDGCRCAAIQCAEKQLYGVQFHPEVLHTQYGKELLQNFLARCPILLWYVEQAKYQTDGSRRDAENRNHFLNLLFRHAFVPSFSRCSDGRMPDMARP